MTKKRENTIVIILAVILFPLMLIPEFLVFMIAFSVIITVLYLLYFVFALFYHIFR